MAVEPEVSLRAWALFIQAARMCERNHPHTRQDGNGRPVSAGAQPNERWGPSQPQSARSERLSGATTRRHALHTSRWYCLSAQLRESGARAHFCGSE